MCRRDSLKVRCLFLVVSIEQLYFSRKTRSSPNSTTLKPTKTKDAIDAHGEISFTRGGTVQANHHSPPASIGAATRNPKSLSSGSRALCWCCRRETTRISYSRGRNVKITPTAIASMTSELCLKLKPNPSRYTIASASENRYIIP